MNQNKIIGVLVCIILGCVVIIVWNSYSKRQSIPATQSISVSQPVVSKPVTLDLSTDAAKKYQTQLTAALSEPADFEGVFKIVSVDKCNANPSLGENCYDMYAVNKATGKVYVIGEDAMGYSIEKDYVNVEWPSDDFLNMYYDKTTDTFRDPNPEPGV